MSRALFCSHSQCRTAVKTSVTFLPVLLERLRIKTQKTLEQRVLHFSGYFVLRRLDARMCKGIEMHKRNSSLVHPRSSHCSVSKQLPGFPLNTRLCKKAQELGRTKCQKKCITHSMPMRLPGPSLGTCQVPVTAVTHVLPHRSLVNPCC